MALNLKESFERSCRLCAKEQDVTLMIFSAEAEALLLKNKLNKYLLLEVEEDDKLPKNICIQCCTKLQTVCEFIDTVHKSQDILLTLSLELDNLENLTHDYKSLPTHELVIEDESKITPMEISIDPMVVLQNSDFSPSLKDSCFSQDDDVARMHGLDGVDVTIKLIKKEDPLKLEDCKGSEESYHCLLCSKSFPSLISLTRHNLNLCRDNVDKDDYTCSICKQEFIHKSQLVEHLKTHMTGGICNECGRHFSTAEKLTSHMAVHTTKENAFFCKICGRSFRTQSYLKAHSIAHSNERPFQCKVCNKTFKRNQELKFHMNQHTGAKPYQCPFCEKTFANSGNCYAHRRRIHPGRIFRKKTDINNIIEEDYKLQQTSTHFIQETNTIEQNTVQYRLREKIKQSNHNDVQYPPSDSNVSDTPEEPSVGIIESITCQERLNDLCDTQAEERNADHCITNTSHETMTLEEIKIDENSVEETSSIMEDKNSSGEEDLQTPEDNNVEQNTQLIPNEEQKTIVVKNCTYPNLSPSIPIKGTKKQPRKQFIQYKETNSTLQVSKSVKYSCYLCPKEFNRRDNYTYHIYQHTGKKPFKCTFCSERFVTRKGLLLHHNDKHPTENRPLALLSKNILLM